ncbi:MAG: DinB family protein [Promethearchaeota archaeon]
MTLLTKLADYMDWANDKIWGIVETLSDNEFSGSPPGTEHSVHSKYIHLAQDTWEWYHDWLGEEPKEPDFQDMTRGELYEFIKLYTAKWTKLIDDRSMDEIQSERDNKILTLQFEEMFFHMVNHFTYHRGQIVMFLRLLERDVPMTDYVPHRFSML